MPRQALRLRRQILFRPVLGLHAITALLVIVKGALLRSIISGATRRWIQPTMAICAMPPSMPVPASSTAPPGVECTSASAARLSMVSTIRPSRPLIPRVAKLLPLREEAERS